MALRWHRATFEGGHCIDAVAAILARPPEPARSPMASKAPKGTRGKRPPEPADSHAVIAGWMDEAVPGLQPVVRQLDKLVRDNLGGLQYAVKWKKAFYGLPGRGWIIEMVAYDVSVNMVFHGGKAL